MRILDPDPDPTLKPNADPKHMIKIIFFLYKEEKKKQVNWGQEYQ